MKKYEKPKLLALSLTGNEQLCGSCRAAGADNLLYQDSALAEQILNVSGGDQNGNGVADRGDFINLFGSTENCSNAVDIYCKFTGAWTVAWS